MALACAASSFPCGRALLLQTKVKAFQCCRYHKTNAGLDLLIANLKLKVEGLQQEVLIQRTGKSDSELLVKRMQHDLEAVLPYIQVRSGVKTWVLNFRA